MKRRSKCEALNIINSLAVAKAVRDLIKCKELGKNRDIKPDGQVVLFGVLQFMLHPKTTATATTNIL